MAALVVPMSGKTIYVRGDEAALLERAEQYARRAGGS
jgi:hypothetical protein